MSPDGDYLTETVPQGVALPWWRVALMMSAFSVSLPTLVTGVDLARVTTMPGFVTGMLAGGLILTIIGSLMGIVGARTRLSSYMLARLVFGERGAMALNAAFAVSLLGWFGVNIDLFADAMRVLLATLWGWHGPIWPVELGSGLLMTLTTTVGLCAIDRLSLVLTPLLFLATVWLLLCALDVPHAGIMDHMPHGHALRMGDVISAVVGGVAVGAVIMPDLCRFLHRDRDVVLVSVCAYLLSASFVMFAGGVAGVLVPQGGMLQIMLHMGLGLLAFGLVFGGTWTVNALNLYSVILSAATVFPARSHQTSRPVLTLACGLLGTVLAFGGLLDHFIAFLFYLSIAFVPVAGIVTVDFFVLHALDHDSMVHAARRPVVWRAFVSWAAGTGISLLASAGVVTLTGIAACDAILGAGMTHALAGFVGRRVAGRAVRRP